MVDYLVVWTVYLTIGIRPRLDSISTHIETVVHQPICVVYLSGHVNYLSMLDTGPAMLVTYLVILDAYLTVLVTCLITMPILLEMLSTCQTIGSGYLYGCLDSQCRLSAGCADSVWLSALSVWSSTYTVSLFGPFVWLSRVIDYLLVWTVYLTRYPAWFTMSTHLQTVVHLSRCTVYLSSPVSYCLAMIAICLAMLDTGPAMLVTYLVMLDTHLTM